MHRTFHGRRLREARIAANVRPERLALDVGRSMASILAYERGMVDPPISVLAHLADLLGVRVDDFLADGVADRAS